MKNSFGHMIRNMFADRTRRRKRMVRVGVLSVLVVCGVFLQLMQPVITKTADPICGNVEHSHGEECRQVQMICSLEEGEAHTHADQCWEEQLTCGEREHNHSDACYPEEICEPILEYIPETALPTAMPNAESMLSDVQPTMATDDATMVPDVQPTMATDSATMVPDVQPTMATDNATMVPDVQSTMATDNATMVPDMQPTATPDIGDTTHSPETDSTAEPTGSGETVPDDGTNSAETSTEATVFPEETQQAEPTHMPAENDPQEEIVVQVTAPPPLSPEGMVIPTDEPLFGLPEATVAAMADAVYVGEELTWEYATRDALQISYELSIGDSVVDTGTLDECSGRFVRSADISGRYELTIMAGNDAGVAIAGAAAEAVDSLQLEITADRRSCFAGDSVSFALKAVGGMQPAVYEISVYQGETLLWESEEFEQEITVQALSADKVTALAATVSATDACGNTATATCEVPVALGDHETAAQWGRSAAVELTGIWPLDLVAVAQTQVGYEESATNFVIRNDGSRQGYTRYGDWYGMPYEEWCAMFASFCLKYADVPLASVPREAGCQRWIGELKQRELYAPADDYGPAPGDLVFFDWEGDGSSDHTGIVTGCDGSTVTAIEGNSAGAVRERTYEIGDPQIIGYGLINLAYERSIETEIPVDDNPVQVQMWLETTDEAEMICMAATIDGVEASSYLWQWQSAPAPEGEWEDIPDAVDLVYATPSTEESFHRYYRICGTLDPFSVQPAVYSLRDVPEEQTVVDAPEPYLESDAQTPSIASITGDFNKQIDVIFVQVDANGKVLEIESDAEKLTLKGPSNGSNGEPFSVADWFEGLNKGTIYGSDVRTWAPYVGSTVSASDNVQQLRVKYSNSSYYVQYNNGRSWFSARDTNSSVYLYYIPYAVYTVVSVDSLGQQITHYEAKYGTSGRAEVTLPEETGYEWICKGTDGATVAAVQNGDGTVTFVIDPVTQSYTISAVKQIVNVTYDLNLDPEPFDPDSEYVPRVGGQTLYEEQWDCRNGSYTVLAPKPDEYNYYGGSGNALVLMQFDSWLGSDNRRYAPGDAITLTGDMTLTAQWTAQTNKNKKVDFYVVYNCSATNVSSTDSYWYTKSVFSSEVITERTSYSGTDKIIGDGNNFGAEYHKLISKLHTEGYTKGNYHYQLSDYPNNDYVFRQLREMQQSFIDAYNSSGYTSPDDYLAAKNALIVLNGEIVAVEDINASNFTLEWYIFKRQDDGWHIDGRLIPRKASLTIRKTFYGDADSIAAVKGNYSISISGLNKKLTLDNATSVNGNTYTWTLKEQLDKGGRYTISENGYIADVNREYLTAAEYIVTNAGGLYSPADRWLRYPSGGVTVIAQTYDSDVTSYQTVSLLNSYLPETTMMIHKVNSTTGSSLSGVRFHLSDPDGEAIAPLYKSNGVYYIDVPAADYTVISDGIVETDSFGRIIVGWAEGSSSVSGWYRLTEIEAPEGYEPIDPVDFAIRSSSGAVTLETNSSIASAEGSVLRVGNVPQTSRVMARKVWSDGTDIEVEVELYRVKDRTRTLIGSAVLNTSNDWEYEWEGLPLYEGNAPAVYELSEKRIGNMYYESAADTDGYPMYNVTMEPMVYHDNNGNLMAAPIEGSKRAYRALLVVNNRRSTGAFEFGKYDPQGQRLAGAEFALYPAGNAAVGELQTILQDGEVHLQQNGNVLTPAYTAVSDLNGNVSFGRLPVGSYFMTEQESPYGYQSNMQIYSVKVDAGGSTLELDGKTLSGIQNRLIEADVSFIKESDGNPLSGAVFGIYSDVACTVQLKEATSGEDGSVVFCLPVGSYWMQEIRAPEGYIAETTVFQVLVLPDGTSAIYHDGVQITRISNEPITADVIVSKVDESGRPLSGAQFRIDMNGEPYLHNGVTAAFEPAPEFTISGLKNGTYAIAEKTAPMGYYRISGTITFTVNNGAVTDVYCPPGASFDAGSGRFTVTNVAGSVLPDTGGIGSMPYTAGGAAVMLLSLLMGYDLLWRRRGRREMK